MPSKFKKNSEDKNLKFAAIFVFLILTVVIGIFLLFKPFFKKEEFTEEKVSPILKDGIAIINIQGLIQLGSTGSFWGAENYNAEYIVARIQKYSRLKKVRGIVLRINSPGGTIAAVQEIYNALTDFKLKGKIIVASLGDIAASGGYYIASAANKIVANPGSITGSIGVIIASPSFVSLFNKIGINYRVFKSGKYKDLLSPYREITKEEKDLIQSVVDDAYQQFFDAVKFGRNMNEEKLKKYADGRIFTGKQAKYLGFVDELGDLNKAIEIAGEMAGLGKSPYIIKEKFSIWQQIFGFIQEKNSAIDKLLNSKFNYVPVFYLYQP